MQTSGFSNTAGSGSGQEVFRGFSNECQAGSLGLGSTPPASPDQRFAPLQGPGQCFLWPQPSSPAHEAHHPADVAAASVTLNGHRYYQHLHIDRPLSLPYDRPFSDPQDWSTHTDISTTHQSYMTLNAGRSPVRGGLQGHPPSVVNGSSSVPSHLFQNDLLSPTNTQIHMQYRYNGGLSTSSCALGTPYRYIQSSSAARGPSSTPSGPPLPPMVPRPTERVPPICQNSRTAAKSPYRLGRTSSFPAQSPSRTCEWIKDDGTKCGAQITWTGIPGHLTSHGVKRLARNHPISCRWSECQLRGRKGKMKRESIVRHVREKHLHYTRGVPPN